MHELDAACVETVRRTAGLPPCSCPCITPAGLRSHRSYVPGPCGAHAESCSRPAAPQALREGIQQLCPRANILTAEGVALARSAGLLVRAWGIKSVEVSRCAGGSAWGASGLPSTHSTEGLHRARASLPAALSNRLRRSAQLLHHAVACGAQGATVNWPDEAQQALEQRQQQGHQQL